MKSNLTGALVRGRPRVEGVEPGKPHRVVVSSAGGRLACSLLGVSKGQIDLLAPSRLEAGDLINVRFGRVSVAGRVVYCKARSGGYRIAISPESEERYARSDPRFPIDAAGTLIVLPDGKEPWSAPCRLTDFSRTGVGLESGLPVTARTMVCIETTFALVVGEVQHCAAIEPAGCRIGIELTDVLVDRPAHHGVIGRLRLALAEFVLGRPISGFGVRERNAEE